MLASGYGSCSSWSCALSPSSSWTGMTANATNHYGLYTTGNRLAPAHIGYMLFKEVTTTLRLNVQFTTLDLAYEVKRCSS